MVPNSAYAVFELAHGYLVFAAKTSRIISLAGGVSARMDALRTNGIPHPVFAEALFLGAAGVGLAVAIDHPLPDRSKPGKRVAARLGVLRAQALVYRRSLSAADDLVDATLSFAIANVEEARHFRSEVDWLLHVMRRLAATSIRH